MRTYRASSSTLCAFALALCASCGTPGTPLPPSLQLPRPVDDLKAVRVGDQVQISFHAPEETTDHQTMKHLGRTELVECAEDSAEHCRTSYTWPERALVGGALVEQTFPLAKAVGYIAIDAYNLHGRTAGVSARAWVPTIEAWPEPNGIHAEVSANAVIITAVPRSTSPIDADGCIAERHACYRYVIYRQRADQKRAERIGSVPAGRPYYDTSFEWQQQYTYTLHSENESTAPDGKRVTFESGSPLSTMVFTKDVFPPSAPTGLVAVFTPAANSTPPSIDLNWNPNTERDLAGYNVYRALGGSADFAKINRDVITAPVFSDADIRAGESYSYSVTAVDVRGNESARASAAREAVPR